MAAIGDALRFAFGMTWEVLWALILGFALSGGVQALESKQQMVKRGVASPDNADALALTFAAHVPPVEVRTEPEFRFVGGAAGTWMG